MQSYPAQEWGGVIWIYMGPPEHQPQLPRMEWALLPPEGRYIGKSMQECNWLQVMEGDIDSAHISYLHGGRPPVVATGDDDERAVTQVIEVDAERLDPWFVAAFLGAEASAIPVTNTLGALSREDLRRCRIPRVSRTEQLRFGQAFRKLDELQTLLRKATDLTASVIETAAYGLRTGALAPPD